MEIFDVVDKDDNIIGTATRQECHSNPKLIHHTVHFSLVDPNSSRILITQRSFMKEHDAGKICFLGEHILSGETYKSALIRALKEELKTLSKKLIPCATNIFRYDKQTELVRFYLASWNGKSLYYDKAEIESVEWLSIHDLKNSKKDYSEMTKYWVEHVQWNNISKT